MAYGSILEDVALAALQAFQAADFAPVAYTVCQQAIADPPGQRPLSKPSVREVDHTAEVLVRQACQIFVRGGEDVCAVVVFKDDVDTPEQNSISERILSDGREGRIQGLSAYESPSRVIPFSTDRLPMTSTGKIQRSALRTLVNSGLATSG